MRKQQDAADNELEIKKTPTHVIYKANTCRIWEDSYNSILFTISFSTGTSVQFFIL